MLDTDDHRITRAAIDEQVELWLEQHHTTPITADPAGNGRAGDPTCR